MINRVIRIGTRGSALAIAQSEEVVASLRAAWPQIQIEVIPIMPDGDRRKTAPLQALGRGTFVKGLEEPLLKGEIDLAVHSAKDMPSTLPRELAIVAYPERKDPRDVIVNRWHARFEDLPVGAKLGTSSPRRAGQLLSARPDINIVPIRGNVDTRLGKVGEDAYDGVVLASAGLERLGRGGEISESVGPRPVRARRGPGRYRSGGQRGRFRNRWSAYTPQSRFYMVHSDRGAGVCRRHRWGMSCAGCSLRDRVQRRSGDSYHGVPAGRLAIIQIRPGGPN